MIRRLIPLLLLLPTLTLAQSSLTGTVGGLSQSVRSSPTYLTAGTVSPSGLPAPSTCSQVVSGRVCYNVTVSVSGLEDVPCEVRVAAHTAGATLRTVILMAGVSGNNFWSGASGSVPNTSINTYLLPNGVDVVELKFGNPTNHSGLSEEGWTVAANGSPTGGMALAARIAGMVSWVNTNLLIGSRLCVSGNSMGSSALWYALADYGQHTIISDAVLTSGPVATVIDRLCSQPPLLGNGIRQSWYGGATNGKSGVFDQTYGYFVGDQNGPCTANDANYLDEFLRDGNEHDSGALTFPNTKVSFIFGDLDSLPSSSGGNLTNARWRGEWLYYRALYLGQSTAGGLDYYLFPNGSNVDHTVQASATGADYVTQKIRDDCKAWP